MSGAFSNSTDTMMWLASSVVIVLTSLFFAYPQPPLRFEQDILPLARTYAAKNGTTKNRTIATKETTKTTTTTTTSSTDTNKTPLKGICVVITGATGGIGLGLVEQFALLGATVVALGRSPDKLKALKDRWPDNKDIVTMEVQLTDLMSVQKTANDIVTKFSSIDILINNAGIHYVAVTATNSPVHPPKTHQGFDLSWGVNYMSHFLLTEKLLQSLQTSKHQPTIVQISSSFHWAVDGSDLIPSPSPANDENNGQTTLNDAPPLAAIPGIFTNGIFGPQRAYANSKFAQILHARALQRRYPTLVVRSICPCWVGTGIAGTGLHGLFLGQTAYPNNGYGIKSALVAALDTTKRDSSSSSSSSTSSADWYTNSQATTMAEYFPRIYHAPWFYKYQLRDAVALTFAGVLWTFQKFFAVVAPRTSAPETYMEDLQESLYEWSLESVKPFLGT